MIKQTMNRQQFADEIRSIRPENFSYAGLYELFDYLEDLSDDIGEDIEFDAIAICCDYSEMSIGEAIAEYSDSIGFDLYEWHDKAEELTGKDAGDLGGIVPVLELAELLDDCHAEFLELLSYHTTVIKVDDTTIIIIQCF